MTIWLIILISVSFAAFLGGGLFMSITHYHAEQEMEERLRTERARKVSIELVVWVREESGRQWARILHGTRVDPREAVDVLGRAHLGRAFSEEGMSGYISRRDFRELRDWLIESEFAKWKDANAHNLGVEFTNTGRALLRAAHEHAHPSPLPPPSPTPKQYARIQRGGVACACVRTHNVVLPIFEKRSEQ